MIEYFASEKITPCTIINPNAGTMSNGVFTPSTTAVFTGYCIWYQNSASSTFDGTQFATSFSYTAIFDYDELSSASVTKDSIIKVGGIDYKIQSPDNIVQINDIIQITCYRTGNDG